MPAAPLPDDENERVQALLAQHILDTGHDPHFDGLVDLAADLFGVPIALVSLVDLDRQWFKAAHGLCAPETPRDQAFCAHAILNPHDVLVVEDAAADPRFADNPLVTGAPHIRFYAGAPVLSDCGKPLGTLCLIDTRPRNLDSGARQRLRQLADSVSAMVQLHRSTIRLRAAATQDALTGLANRAAFDVRLDEAVAAAGQGRPCALLLADLDGLKAVNDGLGHQAGDALLREVARRLNQTVRGTDLAARFGGDEFAVVITDAVEPGTPASVARRILECMRAPMTVCGQQVIPRLSIGVAQCPLDAAGARGLLLEADKALYTAKRLGGDRFLLAGETPSPAPSAAGGGRSIESALRHALSKDQLQMHWQPYFHAASRQLCGFEGLLRWNHITGAVAPSLFLPLAEASGLIAGLDHWVLRSACRAARDWPGKAQVAVNLSAHWFSRGDVVQLVHEALDESGLDPARLELELTERTLVSSRDVAARQMIAVRGMGVRLALDDFGTGYSSLAYLRQFPFDKVKLDRAFIAALGEDAKADAVARAIIQMGHALGMVVCAEGVETPEQLAFLIREGCDLAQGYLLGKPAAEPAFSLQKLRAVA